jgi:hypothetical protein
LSARAARDRELARTGSPEKRDRLLPSPTKVDESVKSSLRAPSANGKEEVKASSTNPAPPDGKGDQAEQRKRAVSPVKDETTEKKHEAGDRPKTDQVYGNVGHNREDSKRHDLPKDLRGPREESAKSEARRRRNETWQYLCQVDAIKCFGGVSPERLWYLGSICGHRPGTREGLPYEYCIACQQQAYWLTIETAQRVLVDLLSGQADVVRVKLTTGGLDAAKEIREDWSECLADLLVETRPGQLSELYRRTERVFIQWEETWIRGYKARQPSLDEALHKSETELKFRFSEWERGGRRDERAKRREREGGALQDHFFHTSLNLL